MKNKLEIIHCRSNGVRVEPAEPWSLGEPAQFMYMPAGLTTITAGFRDKAINITVCVDQDTARTVQASFENLKANTPKQKPFGCIEHREEEASVHPVEFGWGSYDGDDGVLITAEPTKLGVENVNGKVHRSWSPSFSTDADYAKAKLEGGVYRFQEGVRGSTANPARITGIDFCVGTLTNKPAFRNMPPVKAKLNEEGEEVIEAGAPTGNDNASTKHRKLARESFRAAQAASGKRKHDEVYEHASEATKQAGLCSAAAAHEKSPEGHEDAANAHHDARRANNLAGESARARRNKEAAAHFDGMATVHYGKANAHIETSDLAAEDPPLSGSEKGNTKDNIRAGGPGSGPKKTGLSVRMAGNATVLKHSMAAKRARDTAYAEGSLNLEHTAKCAHEATCHANRASLELQDTDREHGRYELRHASEAHGAAEEAHMNAFEAGSGDHHRALADHHAMKAAGFLDQHRAKEAAEKLTAADLTDEGEFIQAEEASVEDQPVTSESIFARLEQPTPIDIIFKRFQPEPVAVKSVDNIFARLSETGRPSLQ